MPATLTYPGVYIEELSSGVHTITGVATSIAAFVGWADQGSTTQAVLVQSWMDFQREFGGLDSRSLLGYSVSHFFNNGGTQAYIVRLAQTTKLTSGASTATAGAVTMTLPGAATMTFTASSSGAWSSSYGVLISPSSDGVVGHFMMSVVYAAAGSAQVALASIDNLAKPPASLTVANITYATTGTASGPPPYGLFMLNGGADGNGVNVEAAAAAALTVTTTGTNGFVFTANNPGSWGNLVAIGATPQPGDTTNTRFSLNVVMVSSDGSMKVVETYNNLSVTPSDPLYVVNVVSADSNYVSVAVTGTPTTAPNRPYPPATLPTAPYLNNPTIPNFLTGGFDGIVLNPLADTSSGGPFMSVLNADGTSGNGGVHLLDRVPIFNLLCVPGETDPTTISLLQGYCFSQRAFYIVDSPGDQNNGAGDFNNLLTSMATGVTTGVNAINSALYYPWVEAPDPLQQGRLDWFPPCGFVAGLYAATDAARGVWKAPAGIDASLTGAAALSTVLTDLENGTLNAQAVNCLRNFRVYGNIIWGARTLRGNDQAGSDWKYVPIRRLALFLESSLYNGTQWVVFEPNDETLWGQIRLNVGTFMQGLFLQGAFQGTTPSQAYFVKCDAENNPDSQTALGIVNILVGFAPLYPAEFVVIQIQQMAAQAQ